MRRSRFFEVQISKTLDVHPTLDIRPRDRLDVLVDKNVAVPGLHRD